MGRAHRLAHRGGLKLPVRRAFRRGFRAGSIQLMVLVFGLSLQVGSRHLARRALRGGLRVASFQSASSAFRGALPGRFETIGASNVSVWSSGRAGTIDGSCVSNWPRVFSDHLVCCALRRGFRVRLRQSMGRAFRIGPPGLFGPPGSLRVAAWLSGQVVTIDGSGVSNWPTGSFRDNQCVVRFGAVFGSCWYNRRAESFGVAHRVVSAQSVCRAFRNGLRVVSVQSTG
jgi:hypothetical protein